MENIKKEKLRCTFCNRVVTPTRFRPGDHNTCQQRRAFIKQMKLMTNEELNNKLKELYNR